MGVKDVKQNDEKELWVDGVDTAAATARTKSTRGCHFLPSVQGVVWEGVRSVFGLDGVGPFGRDGLHVLTCLSILRGKDNL